MRNRDAATLKQRHRDEKQGTLYISAGLPGSGKTTFLKKVANPDEIVISRDDIRFGLLKEGESYFSHENEVFDMFADNISGYLSAGKNVYADATHLSRASQVKLLSRVLLNSSPRRISYIHFDIPIGICLQRNELRKGTKAYVPEKVIRNMAEKAEFEPCLYIDDYWIVDKDGKVYKGE